MKNLRLKAECRRATQKKETKVKEEAIELTILMAKWFVLVLFQNQRNAEIIIGSLTSLSTGHVDYKIFPKSNSGVYCRFLTDHVSHLNGRGIWKFRDINKYHEMFAAQNSLFLLMAFLLIKEGVEKTGETLEHMLCYRYNHTRNMAWCFHSH